MVPTWQLTVDIAGVYRWRWKMITRCSWLKATSSYHFSWSSLDSSDVYRQLPGRHHSLSFFLTYFLSFYYFKEEHIWIWVVIKINTFNKTMKHCLVLIQLALAAKHLSSKADTGIQKTFWLQEGWEKFLKIYTLVALPFKKEGNFQNITRIVWEDHLLSQLLCTLIPLYTWFKTKNRFARPHNRNG